MADAKELRTLAERPHFAFHHPALSPDTVTVGREPDETYRRNNFDLCRAVDMTKVSIVLSRMAEQGWLDKREAELLHTQASSLLALMRTANNRAHAALLAKAAQKQGNE